MIYLSGKKAKTENKMKFPTKTVFDYQATLASMLTVVLLAIPAVIIAYIEAEVFIVTVAVAVVIFTLASVAFSYFSTLETAVFMPDRVKIYARGKEIADMPYKSCTVSYAGIGGIWRLRPFSVKIALTDTSDKAHSVIIPCTARGYKEILALTDKWGAVLNSDKS